MRIPNSLSHFDQPSLPPPPLFEGRLDNALKECLRPTLSSEELCTDTATQATEQIAANTLAPIENRPQVFATPTQRRKARDLRPTRARRTKKPKKTKRPSHPKLSTELVAKIALRYFKKIDHPNRKGFAPITDTPLTTEELKKFRETLPEGYQVTVSSLRATLGLLERSLPSNAKAMDKVYRQLKLFKTREKTKTLSQEQVEELKKRIKRECGEQKPSRVKLCHIILRMTYKEEDKGASAILYNHRSSMMTLYGRLSL